jgi:hypothetical protein
VLRYSLKDFNFHKKHFMPDDSLYPFVAKQIAIQGHNLSFLDQGQGKVIVMLHGNPSWSFYYRNLVISTTWKSFLQNSALINFHLWFMTGAAL